MKRWLNRRACPEPPEFDPQLCQRIGQKPWSSGYGRRRMFWRLWVRIPVPNTGWTFFKLICCKNYIWVCMKKTEDKWKRGRGRPIKNIHKDLVLFRTSERITFLHDIGLNYRNYFISNHFQKLHRQSLRNFCSQLPHYLMVENWLEPNSLF